MPLNLNNPVDIKTGYMIEQKKIGSKVEILSLTFRFTEGTVMVEYRIPADDNTRDHRSATTVKIADLDKTDIKKVIKSVYQELKKLPGFAGTITDDNI